MKQNIHRHKSNTSVPRVSPFNTAPVTKACKARAEWSPPPFHLPFQCLIKENYEKKENLETKTKI